MKIGDPCLLDTSVTINDSGRACKLADMQKDMRETSDRKDDENS